MLERARRSWRRARPRPEDAAFAPSRAGAALIRPRRLGHLLLLTIAGFCVLFVAWASWARLDEVTRGAGRVIPSRQIQIVQNLEGGILAEILVAEGAIVAAGEVLLRIDNVAAAAELRGSRQRHLALRAALSRLQAEVDETGVSFPAEVLAEARAAARNELALFNARQAALQSELDILNHQAEQRAQALAELESRQGQLERSHALAAEELQITAPLARQGVVAKVDLLRLRRQVNDLQGEIDASRLALPRLRAGLREANRRIEERFLSFRAEAQRELNSIKAEADALAESLTADSDRVQRTEVRSPVRGTVKRLLVNTLGGVVQPGADLVEIVPLEDTLLVEAQIRPADIAFLRPGLPAQVKITAYDYAVYGSLAAKLEAISADTIVNDDGESFYRIRVRTTENSLRHGGEPLPIIPGMTAQVDILTGAKTVMDYLLKPILRARQTALRER